MSTSAAPEMVPVIQPFPGSACGAMSFGSTSAVGAPLWSRKWKSYGRCWFVAEKWRTFAKYVPAKASCVPAMAGDRLPSDPLKSSVSSTVVPSGARMSRSASFDELAEKAPMTAA